MKNKITLLFLIFSACAFSQRDSMITNVHDSPLYLKNGTTYKFKELEPYFNQFPDSKSLYERKHKNRITVSRVWFGLSAISFGIGATSDFDKDMYCDFICIDYRKHLGNFFGIVTGTIALITHLRAMKQRPTIIDYHNDHFNPEIVYQKNPMYLNFQTTKNGAGLVLSF